jgi:integrase
LYNRNADLLKKEGVIWPFVRGDAPQIHEDTINAPALEPDLIIEMIRFAKASPQRELSTFLALSTTYGMRREELTSIGQDDVHYRERTIHVSTMKHGRERTHLIPPPIVPYLQQYDFNHKMTHLHLLNIWYRIEYGVGFAHIARVGYHSIRRTLDTMLLDSLPQSTVMSFMRWKQRTSSNMAYRYSAQKFVGREGTSTQVIGESLETDKKVFAVHPFVKYWEEE